MRGTLVMPPYPTPLPARAQVLATEWIEGEQLARSPPEVINRLIATGVDCFISQLLDVGFFHSDPHPGDPSRYLNPSRTPTVAASSLGNLLVDARGRLVLIDAGPDTSMNPSNQSGRLMDECRCSSTLGFALRSPPSTRGIGLVVAARPDQHGNQTSTRGHWALHLKRCPAPAVETRGPASALGYQQRLWRRTSAILNTCER